MRTASGTIPEKSLGLVFSRQIEGGMHEDLDISNFGASSVEFNLELAIRSDFADIFEVKSESVTRRGEIETEWSAENQMLTTSYVHADFARAVRVRIYCSQGKASYANARLSLPIRLDIGEI